MGKEVWKPIKGFEGFYEVSTFGRVRSVLRHTRTKNSAQRATRGQILKPYPMSRGKYLVVTLSRNGKRTRRTVHRIVAEAFVSNPGNLPQVNHIDGDKTNNYVCNLEWVSAAENVHKAFAMGLCHCEKPVRCLETGQVFRNAIIASRFCGGNATTIRLAARGKRKTAANLHWRYCNLV